MKLEIKEYVVMQFDGEDWCQMSRSFETEDEAILFNKSISYDCKIFAMMKPKEMK